MLLIEKYLMNIKEYKEKNRIFIDNKTLNKLIK
ncbi:hypothetical protein CPF_1079 [Clostridium perfringens ATCC 13124]|uniref:Uncharacterized protein n=1 Tax=Clostridium perfringens (strain ATCC 13124 / DSM 756 / JCM 1290 / NCIMB 6125 / NCTC 8237 / Type A) TaxID=195103 RepID=A0A0H2YQ66_CLOP1|nr:hypothetical protein CPF_1079 [Clostridium perfringens ATCC 13124]